ncbi:MAG: hypothetical protein EXR27_17160 [Betaproteobacteria bacterium]|nr:hypothetical protein [Betaproteobacteria bacterium]
MDLKSEVVTRLRKELGSLTQVPGERSIYRCGNVRLNVRSASQKNRDKYWFDVTPAFYERGKVDYFVYGCGSSSQLYVFPRQEFARMIQGASLGGQKQVPNFTIYLDRHTFEPAGRASQTHDIKKFYNATILLRS